jgi:muramidase (phage lysozyme)
MSNERQLLEQWKQQNPGLYKGLKYAIAGPEGTLGSEGVRYNVMFGGGTFSDLSRHPDRVVRTPGYSSAAAGAYQFMPPTWGNVQRAIGVKDFTPESQDLGLLKLTRDRLKPIGGLAAITKAGGLTPQIVDRLAPEWASLPTLQGRSYYGQPVKSYDQVQKYFERGRSAAGQAPTTQPATTPASTPGTSTTSSSDDFQKLLQMSMLEQLNQPSLAQRLLSGQLTESIQPITNTFSLTPGTGLSEEGLRAFGFPGFVQ